MHAGQLKASLPCAISPSLTHGYGRAGPTKSTLSASDDAWRCQAPASCQSLDQQACATARSRSSRCMALSYLLLLVPKCVPWPTPVHTHRAAVGAARALLQVFRSLAAVCSPSIVAFDFRFSDRSFSATLCEKKIIQIEETTEQGCWPIGGLRVCSISYSWTTGSHGGAILSHPRPQLGHETQLRLC